jgi:hypothetical protein
MELLDGGEKRVNTEGVRGSKFVCGIGSEYGLNKILFE